MTASDGPVLLARAELDRVSAFRRANIAASMIDGVTLGGTIL